IVNIRGKSYRLKEKQKTGLAGIQMAIDRSGKLRKSDR
ncbi:MAG: AAA family ATPase, partial [Thermotoga sp.]